MKRNILIILMAMSSHFVYSQEKKDFFVERMALRLDLTEDQKAKITKMHSQFKSETDQTREQIQALQLELATKRKKFRKEMEAVLTPEQLAKIEKNKPEHQGNRGPRKNVHRRE